MSKGNVSSNIREGGEENTTVVGSAYYGGNHEDETFHPHRVKRSDARGHKAYPIGPSTFTVTVYTPHSIGPDMCREWGFH